MLQEPSSETPNERAGMGGLEKVEVFMFPPLYCFGFCAQGVTDLTPKLHGDQCGYGKVGGCYCFDIFWQARRCGFHICTRLLHSLLLSFSLRLSSCSM